MMNRDILPKNNHESDVIICYFHQISVHSGQKYVLSLLREKYWIIKARFSVHRLVRNCFDCKRLCEVPCQHKMADLPGDGITAEKPPFTFVGVDCFGPFLVKRGRSLVERYGVIFTCLTIRAIHIEIIHSMDTDSSINALRRFIARRGRPNEIRCENGTNLKAGESKLR